MTEWDRLEYTLFGKKGTFVQVKSKQSKVYYGHGTTLFLALHDAVKSSVCYENERKLELNGKGIKDGKTRSTHYYMPLFSYS